MITMMVFWVEIPHHRDGDEIEHDGGDHHMAAALGLQIARHEGPGSTKQRPADDHQRENQGPMHAIEGQPDEDDAQPPDIGLTFGPDIEQARVIGQRHGEAGEDEVGGVVERVAEARTVAEGPVEHDADGLQRVLPDR
jgi:hypothetical protein